ncbi:MAG: twin-arginine translocation signal domain-containing protein, partial [Thermodesulfobacteriota bacterium]
MSDNGKREKDLRPTKLAKAPAVTSLTDPAFPGPTGHGGGPSAGAGGCGPCGGGASGLGGEAPGSRRDFMKKTGTSALAGAAALLT